MRLAKVLSAGLSCKVDRPTRGGAVAIVGGFISALGFAAVAPLHRAPPLVRVGLPADAFGVHVRGRRQVVDGALAAREDAGRVARHDRVPVRARGGLVWPRAAGAGLGAPQTFEARGRQVVEALVHAALEVPERAVAARRPDVAVLVEVARPPRAVARAVAVPVAAVVLLAAVVVADGAPTVGLGRVLVVREATVHVRRQI